MHTDVASVGLYHLMTICITDQVNVFSVRHLQLISDVMLQIVSAFS